MQRLLLTLFILALAACNAPRSFLGRSSLRDRYERSLESAGLATTVMGRQWLEAGTSSLSQPTPVTLPHSEAGYFPSHTPRATGLRFGAPRGQAIRISIALRPDTGAKVFVELWQMRPGKDPRFIRGLERMTDTLVHEVEGEGGVFVLRLQPELLVTLSYTLSITGSPSFAFPVRGGSAKDIGSVWGDPRDAGARRHEGIDIFGKRGTHVIATTPGTVSRVSEGGLGGKVVWFRPAGSSLSLYYAHLDSQMVSSGQQVESGSVLGLMGNTGNARGTATHLHFGIYSAAGAVNPYYYVTGGSGPPARIAGSMDHADGMWRTTGMSKLTSDPSEKGGLVLTAASSVQILAASANQYRVQLPDGRMGWMGTGSVQPATRPLRAKKLREETLLMSGPSPDEAIVGRLPPGASLQIFAVANGWHYGEWEGLRGWIAELQ